MFFLDIKVGDGFLFFFISLFVLSAGNLGNVRGKLARSATCLWIILVENSTEKNAAG